MDSLQLSVWTCLTVISEYSAAWQALEYTRLSCTLWSAQSIESLIIRQFESNITLWLQAVGGLYRSDKAESTMHLRFRLGACTTRAAFSHVPFIQSLIWMVQQCVLQPSPGNLAADSSVTQAVSPLEKVPYLVAFRWSQSLSISS